VACTNGLCSRCGRRHNRKGIGPGGYTSRVEKIVKEERAAFLKRKAKGATYAPSWRLLDG